MSTAATIEGHFQLDNCQELSSEQEEALAVFERACQRYLKMSTQDFLARYRTDGFKSDPELAYKAAEVALLLPLLGAGKES